MRIHMQSIVTAVTLVFVAAELALPAAPAEASSRKAEKIVKKHVAAIGGRKLKAIAAIRATGRVEVREMQVPFTVWRQRPNLSRLEITIMGYDVIQVYDGRTAWWINPIAGATYAQEMPAEYARQLIRWTDFDGPLVDYKRKRHKVKYLGRERLDTGDAYKLKLRLADGDEWYVYIDSETYLEVKRAYTQTYQGRTSTVDTYFSDFVDTDGFMTPRVIRGIGFGGEPFRMTFETLDTGVEADKARFEMPGRKKKRRFAIGFWFSAPGI